MSKANWCTRNETRLAILTAPDSLCWSSYPFCLKCSVTRFWAKIIFPHSAAIWQWSCFWRYKVIQASGFFLDLRQHIRINPPGKTANTREPVFSQLCSSLPSKHRKRKQHPLDISIRQIDFCCNGWSRKLQQYWLVNVQHGHVDRVSENLRT